LDNQYSVFSRLTVKKIAQADENLAQRLKDEQKE
jgi:hypothetical protein